MSSVALLLAVSEDEVEGLVLSIGDAVGCEVFAVVLSALAMLFAESLVEPVDDDLRRMAVWEVGMEPENCHLFTGSASLRVICCSCRESRVGARISFLGKVCGTYLSHAACVQTVLRREERSFSISSPAF